MSDTDIIRLDRGSRNLYSAFNSLLANKVTGLGTERDKSQHSEVQTSIGLLTPIELRSLQRKSGVIRRAVNTYPYDSIQAGWNVDSDNLDTKKLNLYFKQLQTWTLRDAIRKSAINSRLFGDGYIVMGIADGQDPREPVDFDKIKSLRWLLPLSRQEISPDISSTNNYSNPEYYEILQDNTKNTELEEERFIFHKSRVVRIIGSEIDNFDLQDTSGYNDSIIQSFWLSFCAYHPGLQATSIMVQDHRLRRLGIKGLHEGLYNLNPDSARVYTDQVMQRILFNDLARSVAKTEVSDLENEELSNITNQYNGIDKIIEQLKDAWASDADMSRIQLFNMIGVSGLQSGEAFKMAKLDHAYRLNSWMDNKLKTPLEYIYKIAIAAQDSKIDSKFDEWEISFPLLYKMTPVEKLEYQNLASQRDKEYLGMGVFTKEEIRAQFFGAEPNFNIALDEKNKVGVEEPKQTEENLTRKDAFDSGGIFGADLTDWNGVSPVFALNHGYGGTLALNFSTVEQATALFENLYPNIELEVFEVSSLLLENRTDAAKDGNTVIRGNLCRNPKGRFCSCDGGASKNKKPQSVKPKLSITDEPKPKATKIKQEVGNKIETYQDAINNGKNIASKFPLDFSRSAKLQSLKTVYENDRKIFLEDTGNNKNMKKFLSSQDKYLKQEIKEKANREKTAKKLKDSIIKQNGITLSQARLFSEKIIVNDDVSNVKDDLIDIIRLTGNKNKTLEKIIVDPQQDRAYASYYDKTINVGSEYSSRTFYHEYGHHLEYSDKKHNDIAENWMISRAHSGEVKKLSEITGNPGYADDEVAYVDSYVNSYVGKKYSTGTTEVFSMGLEHFDSPKSMIRLYDKDPDHFHLIIGLITDAT